MLQIKICQGFSYDDLTQKVNEALSEIKSENVSVKYLPNDKYAVSIEYEIEEEYKSRLCCDCAYWEDDGHSLANFCTLNGKRVRYNCRACTKYKDLRK